MQSDTTDERLCAGGAGKSIGDRSVPCGWPDNKGKPWGVLIAKIDVPAVSKAAARARVVVGRILTAKSTDTLNFRSAGRRRFRAACRSCLVLRLNDLYIPCFVLILTSSLEVRLPSSVTSSASSSTNETSSNAAALAPASAAGSAISSSASSCTGSEQGAQELGLR